MTTRKQSDERLLRLADLLESLPRKHVRKFDMSVWCECGTAACAVGEATFDPWFKRRGLKLTRWHDTSLYELCYRDFHDFDAAGVFFGLAFGEETFLFHPDKYPVGRRGPKTVAKRIRKFVEQRS